MNPEKDNPLHLSWCDPVNQRCLTATNVLNYFTNRNNPFYDPTCNNEHLRMRGVIAYTPRDLEKMTGIEYILLQAQEPILYVIRKQLRRSPTQVMPIANYYICDGTIIQAPDLRSIVESKILTAIHYLQLAFEECFNFARYHPSIDYYWCFDKDSNENGGSKSDPEKNHKKDSMQRREFLTDASDGMRAKYRQSVDALLKNLYHEFVSNEQKHGATTNHQQESNNSNATSSNNNSQQKSLDNSVKPTTIKTEIEDDSTFSVQNSKIPSSGGGVNISASNNKSAFQKS